MDRCSCPELWRTWDLTYLQVDKSAWYWVISTSRRHEIPGSEVKDSLLLTATAAPRVLAFLSQVPRFQFPHGDAKRVKRYTYTHSGLHYRIGIWVFYSHPSVSMGDLFPDPCGYWNLQMLKSLAVSPSYLPVPHLRIRRAGCTGE